MSSIANALVYEVAYLNLRAADNRSSDDDDVFALEAIGAMLRSATNEEKEALAAAAERAANEALRLYKAACTCQRAIVVKRSKARPPLLAQKVCDGHPCLP